jgi:hypothetical protein
VLTELDADTQEVGNTGRQVVEFDLSDATVHGGMPLGVNTGDKFHLLKIAMDTINGSATRFAIYKVVLVWSADTVLKALGSASA